MLSFYITLVFTASTTLISSSLATSIATHLQVTTRTGTINGFTSSISPNVRQFLGIPFSLPPTGARRWLPPTAFSSKTTFDATNIGPACPQLLVTTGALNTSVFSPNGGNQTEFFPLENFSEDCLTLNVWTPSAPGEALPVIVWFFGGGFTQGGTNAPYLNPQSWVERTREHIVITVNFRSNVFGFPNAPGLKEQNLGLLDQDWHLNGFETT